MKFKTFILIFVLLTLIIIAGCSSNNVNTVKNIDGEKITIFKSVSCGCCDIYSTYMKKQDGFNVEIITQQDIKGIKDKHGIPIEMISCHTSEVGNYFVEGHVPVEAINKLMIEKPDIKGIAMPGMPSGSPGMPGSKSGDFIIYQINMDGSTSEFMRI